MMLPVMQESNIYLAEHPRLVGRVRDRSLQVVGFIFPLKYGCVIENDPLSPWLTTDSTK